MDKLKYECWECQGDYYYDRDKYHFIYQKDLNKHLQYPLQYKDRNGEDLVVCETCIEMFINPNYLGNVWDKSGIQEDLFWSKVYA
jgi:hypothetical protein